MNPDPVSDYASGVLSGRFPAGPLVEAACRRHFSDLDRAKDPAFPYAFDLARVAKILRFVGLLHHYKGALGGKAFEPLAFQKFILGSVFGWIRRDDFSRRFRYAYTEVPRKNGKTFLAAGVGLYMLSIDGEDGAEVYSAATKKEQAAICWNDACKIAKKSPALKGYFRQRWASLEFEPLESFFAPLPSDSDKLDGLNPHCVICDELHAWPNRFLWDVIEDALGARHQPLLFSITTAGGNLNGLCYEQRTHGARILTLNDYVDDLTFAYIAAAPDADVEGDGWKQPRVWHLANPGLGTVKRVDYMQDQVAKASQMPGKEFAVKNKQLNVWTAGDTKWLDLARWQEQAGQPFTQDHFRDRRAYAGLDLSSTVDLTALVYTFPTGGENVDIMARFWIPEATMKKREKTDRVPIRRWVKEGWIQVTPGEIVDYGAIFDQIVNDADLFRIVEVGFDPWNATDLATRLAGEDLDMVQMRQGFATLAAPSRELEKRILRREFRHGGNPVLAWQIGNAVALRDSNDNIRPDKSKSADRIDGVVALVMALGRLIVAEGEDPSVYEDRGVRTI